MTTTILRIVDWDEHFENSRTRNMKVMQWVPIPNKHDGDGYTELIGQKDGPLLYACWITILQVASRCNPRGTLVRGTNTPHSAETLSRMTRIPEKVYEKAIPVLLDIGWLERISIDDTGLRQALQEPDRSLIGAHQEGVPHGTGARLEGREGREGREGKEGTEKPPPLSPSDFQAKWNATRGVKQCKAMNDARKTSLQARVKEDGWADNLDAALAKVATSDFLSGTNDRGWVADVEWFLRPGSLLKVLEGNYDNGNSHRRDDEPHIHRPLRG